MLELEFEEVYPRFREDDEDESLAVTFHVTSADPALWVCEVHFDPGGE